MRCPNCGANLLRNLFGEDTVYAEYYCIDCDEDFTKKDIDNTTNNVFARKIQEFPKEMKGFIK